MNLYIHIPFCASKCRYCHFYSICAPDQFNDYLQSLLTELNNRYHQEKLDTVYFGGGTPSLLPPKYINIILNKLNLDKTTEITLESHPNTLTPTKIKDYYSIGINRLSIGIQSWNPNILLHMGREYQKTQLQSNITYAQSIGLSNINLDHIIAYPYQTDTILLHDLTTSLSCDPTHISIYPLEKHPHTGIKKSPREAKIIRQFGLCQNLLTPAGFSHYEELNFALPGFSCRHNLAFWQSKDYLGLGPSAVSRQGNLIIENDSNTTNYINLPQKTTVLTKSQQAALNRDLKLRLY